MFDTIKTFDDPTGLVKKLVFTKNNAVAESVLYKYPNYETRTVICCSSQSGCPVGCRFCGSGDYFVRSLSGSEIVQQVDSCLEMTHVIPDHIQRLQIMFMSMGEPMLNPKGMSHALETLYAKYPNASLLISTIGPNINYDWLLDISKRIPTIGLQFSIHKSTDAERNLLIPFKNKLTIQQISELGGIWHKATNRKPFFNYCAGPDNSTSLDAQRLRNYFDPTIWNATISVICERNEHVCASNQYQIDLASNFANLLLEYGFNTRVFDPAGQDTIGGGCGQLWFVQDWMKNHPDYANPSCGNNLPKVHTPSL